MNTETQTLQTLTPEALTLQNLHPKPLNPQNISKNEDRDIPYKPPYHEAQ